MTGTLRRGSSPEPTHADPAVQLLLDRLAIEDLFCDYAACVDRRDFVRLADCFVPEIRGQFWGTERRDRKELIDFISGVAFFHTTLHMFANTLIEVNGNSAQLDSDAMIKHHGTLEDGRDYQLNMSDARYGERLERRDGAWRITERAVPAIWSPTGVTRATSEDPAVRWLLDRAEIHDVLTKYALGVDERDYKPVGACFAETFHADYLGHEFEEVEELVSFIRGVEHFGWTRHFLARPLLEVRGDAASSETLAFLSSRSTDDPKGRRERMSAGRYHDEWIRERGRWRVSSRRHGVPAEPLRPEAAPPESEDPSVRYLLDRAEIADLVVTLGAGLDRGDPESVAECVMPELRVERAGEPVGRGPRALLDDQREGLDPEVATNHCLGNQLVRLSGNHAEVETYAYRSDQPAAARTHSPWHEQALRWEHELVRESGRWRVVRHRSCSNRVEGHPSEELESR